MASRRKATIELADHSYERVIAGELHRLAVIAPPWAAWLLTVLVGVGLHLAWPGWIAAAAVAAGGAGLAAQAWHLSRERKTLLGRCLAPVSCVAGFGWMALVVWAGPTRALLGVWFIGDPNSVVVGASGVIFGYLGLLLARGLVERSWWNLGVAAFIGLLYWYQLYNILPTDQPISWQGHLLGLLGGVIAAILFRRKRVKPQPALYTPTLTDI